MNSDIQDFFAVSIGYDGDYLQNEFLFSISFKSSFFGKIGMSVNSTTEVFSVTIRYLTWRKLNVPVVVETDQVQGK